MRKTEKIIKLIGISLIIFALIMNPFVVEKNFSPDKKIQSVYTYFKIIIFEICIILCGLFVYTKSKYILKNKVNFSLLLCSLFICTILFFLSGFLNYSLPFNHIHFTEFNSKYGWQNIPNFNISFENQKVMINSLGYRNNELNNSNNHIIMIGDSVTWGSFVNNSQTISYYLENILSGKNYQVLNLGVAGYSIDQEYLHLKDEINKTKPQIIIFTICTYNDLIETGQTYAYGKNKPMFIIENDALKTFNPKISKNSCTNTLSENRFINKWSYLFCPNRKLTTEQTASVISKIFAETDKLAKEHNSSLIFVISPSRDDFNNQSESTKFFRTFFENENYTYLDYYKIVVDKNLNVSSLYLDVMHYTPFGNFIIAKLIEDELKVLSEKENRK